MKKFVKIKTNNFSNSYFDRNLMVLQRILLSIPITILIIIIFSGALFWIDSKNDQSFDLFALNEVYFIQKVDHFSSYYLIKVGDSKNQIIADNIEAIYEAHNDVFIIDTGQNLLEIQSSQTDCSQVSTIPTGFEKFKPWQFVEKVTMNSSTRTIRLIIQMIIVFYVTNIALKIISGNSSLKVT